MSFASVIGAGSLIAATVFPATSRHVVFLPLILLLPLGFAFRRKSPPT